MRKLGGGGVQQLLKVSESNNPSLWQVCLDVKKGGGAALRKE